MGQETMVVKLDDGEQDALRRRLEGGDFEYRPVEHAHFSARGEGVIATLYRSGKLVVQGAEPSLFLERYLAGKTPEGARKRFRIDPARTLIGSDEAGKGDYFGPLVVAAFKLEPGDRAALVRSGVTDSKALNDQTVTRMAAALQGSFEHAVEILDPPAYNRAHAEGGNLNPILADLHVKAIRRLHEPGIQVLVDRFANERLIAQPLSSLDLELHQETKAEREPAVAAASILARAVFLERLGALSDEFGVDLHKGAGSPTDKAGKRFVQIHGRDALGQVAKLHFKNTQKI